MYKRLGELIGFRFEIAKEIQTFPEAKSNEVLDSSYEFLANYIKIIDTVIKEHKNGFMNDGYYKDY